MKTLKDFIISAVVDILLALSIYLWKVEGLDGAGNIVLFYVWAGVILGILVGFFGNKDGFKNASKWPGKTAYNVTRNVALIAFLAWYGYIATAGFYAFAWMMVHIGKNREPKQAAA